MTDFDPRDRFDIPDDREPEHHIPDAVCDVQTHDWPPEPYCDYCEREGHTFRSCPKRDDIHEEDP